MRRSVIVRRARSLVGTPFRLQGRDAEGVDCIGVIIEAFGLDAFAIPDDYRLGSGGRDGELIETIARFFRPAPASDRGGGRLLLMRSGPRLHLGVSTGDGLVHADLRRGCVVEGPLPESLVVIGRFRRRRRCVPAIGD